MQLTFVLATFAALGLVAAEGRGATELLTWHRANKARRSERLVLRQNTAEIELFPEGRQSYICPDGAVVMSFNPRTTTPASTNFGQAYFYCGYSSYATCTFDDTGKFTGTNGNYPCDNASPVTASTSPLACFTSCPAEVNGFPLDPSTSSIFIGGETGFNPMGRQALLQCQYPSNSTTCSYHADTGLGNQNAATSGCLAAITSRSSYDNCVTY